MAILASVRLGVVATPANARLGLKAILASVGLSVMAMLASAHQHAAMQHADARRITWAAGHRCGVGPAGRGLPAE